MLTSLARAVAIAVPLVLAASFAAPAEAPLRFVMVTHGSAADRFWAAVKEGADRAAEEAGVEVTYRAPESFDLEAMAALVLQAVDEKPAGLIVSIPNETVLAGPIHAAVEAGIPVISINSGFDVGRSLGALLHVGQSEYEAGRGAGEAMRDLGGTKALCLNHETGNVALDLRCKGFIDGFGGSVEVLAVAPDAAEVRAAIEERLAADEAIDVILALNAAVAGEPAVAAAAALQGRTVRVASFDTTDAILAAVAQGRAAFAIDQQPFLQGYLPVQYLAMLHRYGAVPVSNVSTGPKLVREEEAARRLGGTLRPGLSEGTGEGREPKGG
jgi:simple sugar transport system substrate-binding protein